ncbi:hypothetical protein Tco_0153708 [Tanacetum coccineum]
MEAATLSHDVAEPVGSLAEVLEAPSQFINKDLSFGSSNVEENLALTVLHSMESIRRNIFNGIREGDRKISWISWPKFPRLYALENNKECTVAVKMSAPFTFSFRREIVGDGILNGDGNFHVKDVRSKLDDSLLPKADTPTRWITTIPIKLNIFAWKVSLNRLPTRLNLVRLEVCVSDLYHPS